MVDFSNENPKKVLIVNFFGIGDVLFTTPLISNIKAHAPNTKIGYICSRRTAVMLQCNPKIDKVYIYERDQFNEYYKKSHWMFLRKFKAFLGEIKKEKYDMVIDVSLNWYTGFFTWLVGIKNRIGFNYRNRSAFLNHKIDFKGYEDKHIIDYYAGLLEKIGVPSLTRGIELNIGDDDRAWVQGFFGANSFKKGDCVVSIVPGGGASWGKEAKYKRWSAENYAKLADKLIEKYNAKIILIGDKNEIELCRRVSSLMAGPSYLICGQTTIHQFAALAKQCQLNIVNDGGALHIAVAADAATISIFGPVDERVYGPYTNKKHHVIVSNLACRPCYRRFRKAHCAHMSCLNDITVNQVLEKVERAL